MEKKKMKLWKKILLLISILFLIFIIITTIKFFALTSILEKNKISNNSSNCYYYSESDTTIMEYCKKDNIMKLNTRQFDGTGNITFWKDINSNEEFIFWNSESKKYAKNEDAMLEHLPISMYIIDNTFARYIISANPLLSIQNTTYNDKNCYIIKNNSHKYKEIIEKSTGLPLYSKINDELVRKVTYSFNTVNDSDVALPDISQYTLIEN